MRFTPGFYRAAAFWSFASAITTLGLIFLPGMFAPAEDFATRMARVNDPVYRVYDRNENDAFWMESIVTDRRATPGRPPP
jgi:hypothetical protein